MPELEQAAPAADVAAPDAAPPELLEPFTVDDGTETPEIAPEQAEAELEQPPPAEEKPLRFKELRKDETGEFDEDLVEQVVQDKAHMDEARALYARDPDFKAAWLKALIRDKGYTPTPEERAFLDGREKPAAAMEKPAAKESPTPEFVTQFIAEHKARMKQEIAAQGFALSPWGERIEDAVDLIEWCQRTKEHHIDKPAREKAEAQAKKDQDERQTQQSRAANVARWKPEFEAAAKAYPQLVVKTANAYGLWFAPKEAELAETVKALSTVYKTKTMTALIGMALNALGRGLPQRAGGTPAPRVAQRPAPVSAATRPAGRAQLKLAPHEVLEPFTIVS